VDRFAVTADPSGTGQAKSTKAWFALEKHFGQPDLPRSTYFPSSLQTVKQTKVCITAIFVTKLRYKIKVNSNQP
jgi:hypothetical protein